MRRRKNTGRVLAGILAVGLLVSSVPSAVYAVENGSDTAVVAEQEEPNRDESGQESEGTEPVGREDNESGEETANPTDTTPKEDDKENQEEIETDSEQTEEGDEVGESEETETVEEADAKVVAAEVMEADGAEASGSCGENLTWKLEDGTLTVSGTGEMDDYNHAVFGQKPAPWYNSRDKINKVVIQDGVVSIGRDAFYYCTSLTGITIPSSVTSIGRDAFFSCTSLTEITIPSSVTSIGSGAFSVCTSLTGMTIPSSVTSIGDSVFSSCTSLTGITIPNSVTSIGSRAFSSCTSLTGITIPNSVTSIGSYAFYGCTSLTGITIPNSVTSIGSYAFYGCTSLTGITIPSSVTRINECAFYGCTSLTEITIPDGVTCIYGGTFAECTSLTEITIPSSVTRIDDGVTANHLVYPQCGAFDGCSSLREITIPNSVTYIGSYAFAGCGLIEITIPDSVRRIGEGAFRYCTSLTGITIPDSVTSIGIFAFQNCTSLKEITIPNSITSIGKGTFSKCTNLTEITIPLSVTRIDGPQYRDKDAEKFTVGSEFACGAFYGCSSLLGIKIPGSVTSIGSYAFSYCTSLTEITIPSSVTSIGSYMFYNCTSLTGITIPSSVTSVGSNAFSYCTSLTEITIPSSVTHIGEWAFSSCTSLTEITIPSSVTSIGSYVFRSCTSLTEITIPSSVTSIGSYAFYGAGSLSDVYYGGSESDWLSITIGDDNEPLTTATIHYNSTGSSQTINGILRSGDTWKIRWKCTYQSDSDGNPYNGRVEISVNDTNTVEELYLYNEASDQGFPWELAPYNIPKSAINTLVIRGKPTKKLHITTNSFRGYGGLNKIVFEYASGIDSGAFADCTSLRSVGFLSEGLALSAIGADAFKNCTKLTEMDFPVSLKHIGAGAFQNTALGTITLGSNVTEIGDNAFSGCDKLLIRCFENSVAHQYALKNSIPFQLITVADNSVQIHYGDGKTEKFDHNLDYYVSATDSTTYSPQLSHMLIAMSCAAYDEGNVKASMKELGFKNNVCHYSAGDWEGQISYAFGKKTMSNGETLVLVTVRGSSTSLDWLSNCMLGSSVAGASWHAGFESAVNEVYGSLTSFMGGNLNNATYVVTGHSRGAAVANLLEIKLFEAKVSSAKVYGYNFACPDVARAVPTMWNWLGEHNNMFNIGNAPDPVTMVPGAYGQAFSTMPGTTWGKFGQSRWFSKNWNNLSETTLDLSFSAHGQEVYLEYLKKEPPFSSFKTYEQRIGSIVGSQLQTIGKQFNIHCPVDVSITDQDGNMLASVVGGAKNYYGSSFGEVMIFTDGDKKAVFVQGNEPLEIHLTATDEGTMEYMVQALDYNTGEVLSEKIFANVALTDNKQMLSLVDTEGVAENGADVSQVLLYVLGLNETPEKEVLPDGKGTEVPYTGPNEVLPGDIPADGKIPDDLWIAGVKESYTYTGTAIKPEIRVYDGKKRLQPGQDYTASYKNNTKVNDAAKISTAPTITVKGKGNYTGTETAAFRITAVDLSNSIVLTEDITVAYNKKIQKKVPVVTYNGKKLTANRDFTVSYPNGGDGAYKEAGTYDILLTAKSGGNFSGTRTVKCTITENTLLSKVTVKKIPTQVYTGEAIEPELTVTYKGAPLVKDTDYLVSYTDNTEIGTAKAILTGIGKYAGTKNVSFSITGTSLKGASVSGIENKIYNGNDQEQRFTVTLKGRTLTEGIDYDVSYEKNKNVGKASVTIKGKGTYSGTIKKTFTVGKYNVAANADGRFEVTLKQDVVPYAKGGAKPGVTVRFKTGDEKWVTLAEGQDYTLSYRNHTAVNDGSNQNKQPVVTVKGKGSFSGTYGTALIYKIVAQDMGQLKLTAQDKTYQNKKNVYATKITITDLDGKVLKPGTDYNKVLTYSYANDTPVNKNDIIPAGTILKVQAEAKSGGNYTGTLTGEYRIAQAAISSASVSVPKQIYTGQAITLEKNQITVKINGKQLDESQYEIVPDSYKNNVKKGTAAVTIRGVDNYGGTKDVKFTIKAKGFLWWWR